MGSTQNLVAKIEGGLPPETEREKVRRKTGGNLHFKLLGFLKTPNLSYRSVSIYAQ